jgi:thiazole synthase ThiGH ThiG subunit
MDFQKLLDLIKNGVDVAEQLAPVISMIPGAGPLINTAVKVADAMTEMATNVKDRVDEGQIVLNSNQADELDAIVNRLAAINDDLAKRIQDS